jgi:hypothetical protein
MMTRAAPWNAILTAQQHTTLRGWRAERHRKVTAMRAIRIHVVDA